MSWKSKGLLSEKRTTPTTTDIVFPQLLNGMRFKILFKN